MLTNEKVIQNIKDWFNKNNMKTAVINISGGADSTYVAYVLVKALGKENVIGLLQPNGEQKDISDAFVDHRFTDDILSCRSDREHI